MIKSILLPEAEVCLQAKSFNRSSFKSLQQQKAHLSYQVNVTVVCIRASALNLEKRNECRTESLSLPTHASAVAKDSSKGKKGP